MLTTRKFTINDIEHAFKNGFDSFIRNDVKAYAWNKFRENFLKATEQAVPDYDCNKKTLPNPILDDRLRAVENWISCYISK